jgi:hypothetical protein
VTAERSDPAPDSGAPRDPYTSLISGVVCCVPEYGQLAHAYSVSWRELRGAATLPEERGSRSSARTDSPPPTGLWLWGLAGRLLQHRSDESDRTRAVRLRNRSQRASISLEERAALERSTANVTPRPSNGLATMPR